MNKDLYIELLEKKVAELEAEKHETDKALITFGDKVIELQKKNDSLEAFKTFTFNREKELWADLKLYERTGCSDKLIEMGKSEWCAVHSLISDFDKRG